jgi:hypothetical protein
MKKFFVLFLMSCLILPVLYAKPTKSCQCDKNVQMQTMMMQSCPVKMAALRCSLKKLWEEHITYTRNYIISAVNNLEDIHAVAARLMKNQEDIGNAFRPYYGKEVSNKVTLLLKDHIKIATEVVKNAKERNKTELEISDKKWHENADAIATALAGINPHWKKEELKDLLYKHLKCTAGEATSRIDRNWKKDIDNYDEGHEHMLKFSDVLAFGIIEQFPDQFKKAD